MTLLRDRREDGAILPMAAIVLTVVLMIAALVVDLGMARVARQDMQSLADAVALDMVRKIDGRTVSQLETSPDWQADVDQVVTQNSSTVGSDPAVELDLGHLDDDGSFTLGLPSDVPTAVRARTSTSVGFAFASGEGGANRSAIATVDEQACFSLGAYGASLRSQDSAVLSLLQGLLNIDLTVLGPGGVVALEDVGVPLIGLATELGVGTVDELMELDVSLFDFGLALVNVLNRNGDTAAASVLDGFVRAQLQAVPGTVRIGDFLEFGAGNDSALNLDVDLLELLGVSLLAATGDNFVDLGVPVNIPGLANVNVGVAVIEKPRIVCGTPGQAEARSAQLRLQLDASVLNLPLGLANATVTIDLNVAHATGTLQSVRCGLGPDGDQSTMGVAVESGVVGIGVVLNTSVFVDPPLLPRLTVANVTVDVGPTSAISQSETLELTVEPPPADLPSVEMSGRLTSLGLVGLTPQTTVQILPGLPIVGGALDILLNPVLGRVTNLVTATLLPVLDTALITALNPVLGLTGVQLGGATVTAVSRPSCEAPRLVG